jgi:L-asparagine oxygenase
MGIKLYKNIEVGDIGPTPAIPFISDDKLLTEKKTIMAFGSSLGRPIAYKQEQAGQLVQHVLPVFKTEHGQISTSSKSNLELHTETAFHPFKPSYVLLLCLRGDAGAVTTYANTEDIVKKISKKSLELLQQSIYATRIDDSFRSNGEPDFEMIVKILKKNSNDGFDITYDKHFMRGTTSEAQEALDELNKAINESVQDIVLEQGDLLVIDNRTTVHGRKPFAARYDGTDRWVMRLLVVDYSIPRQHLRGNTIITDFGKQAAL